MAHTRNCIISAIYILSSILHAPAYAQQFCAKRQKLLDHMAREWGERPVARALISNGHVLEIVASAEGGWSAIVSDPTGRSCLNVTGVAWEIVEPIEPGSDE